MVFYRILLNGVMVVEGESGQEPVNDTTGYLEPIFGRDQVIVKNDYLINFFTIIKKY
jgi:hypothetical protein